MKKWQKYMLYFALAVLIAGLLFSVIVILSGINSTFEATQRTEENAAMISMEADGL